MGWRDQTPWSLRTEQRREAMERIDNVAKAYLAKGMNWDKAIEAILTEIDGQIGRGGRVGEAHQPEIRS